MNAAHTNDPIQVLIQSGIPKWVAVAFVFGFYAALIGVPLWVVSYLFGIEVAQLDFWDPLSSAKYLLDKVNGPEVRAAIVGGVVAWVLKR